MLFISACLCLPLLYIGLHGGIEGLDVSWMYGLHKANLERFVFGSDIVFTYGPLGYLLFPLYITKTLYLRSLLYVLSEHALMFLSIYHYLRYYRSNVMNTILLCTSLVIVNQTNLAELRHYLFIFIWVYLYLIGRPDKSRLILLTAFSSIYIYMKFSYGLITTLLILSLCCCFILEKRYYELITALLSYLFFVFFAGLFVIGYPPYVVTYIYNAFNIAQYYNYAMQSGMSESYFLWFIFLFWFLYFFMVNRGKMQKTNIYFAILAFGPLFMSYKHGVTRCDYGTLIDCFSAFSVYFLLLYIMHYDKKNMYAKSLLLFSIIFLVLVIINQQRFLISAGCGGWSVTGAIDGKINEIKTCLKILNNDSSFDPVKSNNASLRQNYNLRAQTIKLIDNKSVDIFDTEQVIAELYGMNWKPRPVFQSYSAYSSYLDNLNAQKILSEDAPSFILYKSFSIDDRFAIFDEPSTLRNLLLLYSKVSEDGEFDILMRKTEPVVYTEQAISSHNISSGVHIQIPDQRGLFARIYMDYNVLGNIYAFIYRAPSAKIHFMVNGTEKLNGRLIFANAGNGLYLSAIIPLLTKQQNQKIEMFISSNAKLLYKSSIKVEFFKINGADLASLRCSTGKRAWRKKDECL